MWPWKRKTPEERLHELVSRAEQALEAREFERALNAAREIIDLHHTYGFELAARALSALDREPEALALMEDSVAIAPEVGKLWSHLGEYRSNAGDYAGARAAFERAGALDPELGHASLLNVAITYAREGQLELAWSQLELIPQDLDGELGAAVAVHRAKTLVGLGRHEQALEFCARELEARDAFARTAPNEPKALRNARGELALAKAFALWRGRKDAGGALEACLASTRHTASRGPGLDLMREIGGLDASQARCFQLFCHGEARVGILDGDGQTVSDAETICGFYTTFRVLADTPEEAFAFAREFEMRDWGKDFRSLELATSSETGDRVDGCKGIFFRSGRTFHTGKREGG